MNCIEKYLIKNNLNDLYLAINNQIFNGTNLINYLNLNFTKTLKSIFIPCFVNHNHFILLIIDLIENKSIILNSLEKINVDYKPIFRRSFQIIQLLSNENLNIQNHKFIKINNAPQQPINSNNCACYTFYFLKYYINKDKRIFNLESNQKRLEMNLLLESEIDITKKNRKKENNFSPIQLDLTIKKRKIIIEEIDFNEI